MLDPSSASPYQSAGGGGGEEETGRWVNTHAHEEGREKRREG